MSIHLEAILWCRAPLKVSFNDTILPAVYFILGFRSTNLSSSKPCELLCLDSCLSTHSPAHKRKTNSLAPTINNVIDITGGPHTVFPERRAQVCMENRNLIRGCLRWGITKSKVCISHGGYFACGYPSSHPSNPNPGPG